MDQSLARIIKLEKNSKTKTTKKKNLICVDKIKHNYFKQTKIRELENIKVIDEFEQSQMKKSKEEPISFKRDYKIDEITQIKWDLRKRKKAKANATLKQQHPIYANEPPIKFFKHEYKIDDIIGVKTQLRKKDKKKITKEWLERTQMIELKKLRKRQTLKHASGVYNETTRVWKWDPVVWKHRNSSFFKGYISNRRYPPQFLKQKWKDNKKWSKIPRAGVILIKGNKTFLVQSYRDKFGFPKGGIEKNESIINAAMREFKEETGTDIELSSELPKISIKMYQKLYTLFVKNVPDDFEINTRPHDDVEITTYGWADLDYLMDSSNELWFKCSKVTQQALQKIKKNNFSEKLGVLKNKE